VTPSYPIACAALTLDVILPNLANWINMGIPPKLAISRQISFKCVNEVNISTTILFTSLGDEAVTFIINCAPFLARIT